MRKFIIAGALALGMMPASASAGTIVGDVKPMALGDFSYVNWKLYFDVTRTTYDHSTGETTVVDHTVEQTLYGLAGQEPLNAAWSSSDISSPIQISCTDNCMNIGFPSGNVLQFEDASLPYFTRILFVEFENPQTLADFDTINGNPVIGGEYVLNYDDPSLVMDVFETGTLVGFEHLLAPVPQPASWALMIVGLGFAGGMIRTRKSTTSVFGRLRMSRPPVRN